MEPRPLARIASGGELSRALLALKRALARGVGEESVGVQVFDEVDAGVGGATADKIGRAIAAIAKKRQVLCITHLPAIAAHADAHFVVEKHDGDESTHSQIVRVERAERIGELARMLTGTSASSASMRAATELLAAAARPAAA
jgi:DNA repair protein RecN (Recombination protein N)